MADFDENEVRVLTNSPDDDPSKMKRWGYIAAKPSEFLIVYRRGKMRQKASGQGARAFVWPWDTVAIVPTTLKEVIFQANQITSDNVDVRLRGAVLYRIKDPLAIHRLINFSYRERGELKLARLIADMCRSTAKWLVANMTVEQCLRRRKEEIAAALKREITSVVSVGEKDGWGVEIVTIDIQDVYIQDEKLFAAMQEKFKAEQERQASLARLQAEREVELERLADQSRLEERRHKLAMERAKQESERELFELEKKKLSLSEKLKQDAFHLEEEEKIKLRKTQLEKDREKAAVEADKVLAALRAEAEKIANERQAASLRNLLEAQNCAGAPALDYQLYATVLPEAARALVAAMSGARFHIFQGGAEGQLGPLGFLLSQLSALVSAKLSPAPPPEKAG